MNRSLLTKVFSLRNHQLLDHLDDIDPVYINLSKFNLGSFVNTIGQHKCTQGSCIKLECMPDKSIVIILKVKTYSKVRSEQSTGRITNWKVLCLGSL